jgi:hypothetical protein
VKDAVELRLRCRLKEEDVAALLLSDSDDWMSAQLEVSGDRGRSDRKELLIGVREVRVGQR